MDLEALKKLIEKHTPYRAEIVAQSLVAERYYRNKNDILIGEKQEEDNPLRNADNRIPSNFHGLLVNQKASYMFTAPPMFDVGSNAANKKITNALGDSYAKTCKDLCINASNSSIAWLHYWKDADGKFKYGVIDSKQVIPIWSTDLEKKLLGTLRVYDQTDDDGEQYDVYEYWNEIECQAFRKKVSDAVGVDLQAYMMFMTHYADTGVSEESNTYRHDYGEVPFIPFFNNNIQTGDLDNIKHLIDTYDKVYSGFVNDLEDIQEIIFILSGYDGTDLGPFLQALKKYKTVKVDADADKPGLSTLTIDIPVEAREKLLAMTRKAIFEQGQGVDPQPEAFGNASGVALKFLYSLLELKAGLMETEFKLGFGRLVRAVCQDQSVKCDSIIQTWTRTAITSETEQADIASKSNGVISRKTILVNHPWVESVEDEEKQIKQEQQEAADNYKRAFPPGGNQGGDLNDGEE